MNFEIIEKLDEIEKIIKSDIDLKRYKLLKEKIEKDDELINKIKRLKKIDKYDNTYLSLKKEILNNCDYKEYKTLENDMYLLIKEINSKLNSLKEKSGCM